MLNKVDLLVEKVLSDNANLADSFPEYADYSMASCDDAVEELKRGISWKVVKAKYFLRDRFLQAAQLTSQRHCHHHLYHHLTCATDIAGTHDNAIVKCFKDVLQRIHLREYEIL